MANLMPRNQLVNGGNGSRAASLLLRILAIVHVPTLAVIGWLALVSVSQNKEIALLKQEQVTMQKSVGKLFGLVTDRYYRAEAVRDLAQLEKDLTKHTSLPWHPLAGEKIIQMQGDLLRVQEDVKELEETHARRSELDRTAFNLEE